MATYIPELNHWFTEWWKSRKEISIHHIATAEQPNLTYESGSFLELLFKETFPYRTYHFGFVKTDLKSLPNSLIDRICVKRTIPTMYMSDSTVGMGDATSFYGDSTCFDTDMTSQYNVFSLNCDDVRLLDMLFQYRNGFLPNLDSVDYPGLSTNLSKLIFIYLEVMIKVERGHLDDLGNGTLSNLSLLDEMFLIYVANEAHKLIKNTDFLLSSGQIELAPVRVRYNIENFDPIIVEPPLPYEYDTVVAHLNGEQLNNSEYTMSNDGTNAVFSFSNKCHKLYTEYNFLILDYLYLVNAGLVTGNDSTCMGDGTSMVIIGLAPEPGDKVI